jgi:hypothetical protein
MHLFDAEARASPFQKKRESMKPITILEAKKTILMERNFFYSAFFLAFTKLGFFLG